MVRICRVRDSLQWAAWAGGKVELPLWDLFDVPASGDNGEARIREVSRWEVR